MLAQWFGFGTKGRKAGGDTGIDPRWDSTRILEVVYSPALLINQTAVIRGQQDETTKHTHVKGQILKTNVTFCK